MTEKSREMLICILLSIIVGVLMGGCFMSYGTYIEIKKLGNVEQRFNNIDYILEHQAGQMHTLETAINP